MVDTMDMAIFKRQITLSDLESELSKMPQREAPVTHNFSPGVYVREMFIPKDTLIIGKRHRHETCNILLKGKISIYMGPDQPVKQLVAPMIFNSEPFTKKMGYTHEDTIFLNVHPTSERNLTKIEDIFIIPEREYNSLLVTKEKERRSLCLGET